ncbi:PAS domain-containing sensor histidine kinase [Granulicella arctica]|uniref:PAS domain-containing sensor histidine kinase n=1 Tax=Granulicella arctica TaxID=940613 RepID=UPI0021E01241|nr:PAS domain-containing sensor histidine kinase [Granulicella arctica]
MDETKNADEVIVITADPRALLAAIVDSCEDAIISKDLNGILTSWNAAASRMLGYAPEEMIGQSIFRLVPEELHAEETEILRKIRAGERVPQRNTFRATKDGRQVRVSLVISPVLDEAGHVVGASKIAHQLSPVSLNDEARFRLAAIIESSDDAIVSKNLNGMITSWNAAAYRMFGYTEEEILGHSILQLIPEDLHPEEADIMSKLRAGERINHYETTRVRKNGERFHVSLTISPVRNSANEVIGTSKIARDISDRKQIENLLIQSDKIATMGRMAATIAHEINNPLESVMNLIYLARTNGTCGDEVTDYLRTAESEIERVSHIARQTLGYYRDTGAPVPVLLHEVVKDVLTVYQSKLNNREITVECVFEHGRPIMASKGEMVQVFSNLMANSIDAMPDGGVLYVRIVEKEDVLEVLVRDEGVGIRADHIGRVFEPFFTTKGNLGTGIGLWVSRQLIEKRGGRLTLESSTEAGHSGTSVMISLPFAGSPEQ